jgi:hypothetical protein
MTHRTPQASPSASRRDQLAVDSRNPVDSRRARTGPFSNPASLLGQQLECLANNFTSNNAFRSPMRSLDETLDLLDGLNCEVSDDVS